MNRRMMMIMILGMIEGMLLSSMDISITAFLLWGIILAIPSVLIVRWAERKIWGYNE